MISLLCLNACAMVDVSRLKPGDVVSERRADVIGSKQFSDGTVQTLNVLALTPKQCAQSFDTCAGIVEHASGLDEERRLSSLSELWLGRALRGDHQPVMDDATLDAYLQSARYAYAYLFYTQRTPADRVFDQRQAKVIAFYDYAVERVVQRWFEELPRLGAGWTHTDLAGWSVLRPDTDLGLHATPAELLPASSLRFKGLRNVYQRDGFGSDFVAVTQKPASDTPAVPWRDPRYVAMTGVLVFGGNTLDEVLDTRQVQLLARDPYRDADMSIAGRSVPLGANFTAPYGLWLARSGFAMQSIRSLLGRQGGLDSPRVLLMQPYDPNRRTVVMLHGLASSPEAWVNVANEVLGDEELRRHYQVWQVYYPTNAPIAVNLMQIRRALDETIRHFDPQGTARATQHMMLVGHSMGGVIARLLVSSSGDRLWSLVPQGKSLSAAQRAKLRQQLAPYLQFSPMPQVDSAVFLAAPHRGTPMARHRIARWVAELIRLPFGVLKEVTGISDLLQQGDGGKGAPLHVSNSVDNLSDTDPFIVASENLPISPAVHYHSIIGLYKANGPLAQSSDGVVPYASAHLAGADSEVVIPSWHSVQETPAAILEVRRIMRLHLQRADGDNRQ
ncbi:alpha/beta hydrolase [Rhodanobacter sp. DHG33]|uniref:esterase/lipase family protein n=1 Tax=Rhodanobacter sp. DHG33 TaxID=2775921 RepID=UPI0031BABAA6